MGRDSMGADCCWGDSDGFQNRTPSGVRSAIASSPGDNFPLIAVLFLSPLSTLYMLQLSVPSMNHMKPSLSSSTMAPQTTRMMAPSMPPKMEAVDSKGDGRGWQQQAMQVTAMGDKNRQQQRVTATSDSNGWQQGHWQGQQPGQQWVQQQQVRATGEGDGRQQKVTARAMSRATARATVTGDSDGWQRRARAKARAKARATGYGDGDCDRQHQGQQARVTARVTGTSEGKSKGKKQGQKRWQRLVAKGECDRLGRLWLATERVTAMSEGDGRGRRQLSQATARVTG